MPNSARSGRHAARIAALGALSLIAYVGLSAASRAALADGCSPFVQLAPASKHLPPRGGIIVLKTYCGTPTYVDDLVRGKARARLLGVRGGAPLKVISHFADGEDDAENARGSSVTVLAPARRLRADTEYELRVVWNKERQPKLSVGTLTTAKRPVKRRPRWRGRPKAVRRGDARAIRVDVETESGLLLLEAIVRHLEKPRLPAQRLLFVFDPAAPCPVLQRAKGDLDEFRRATRNEYCPEIEGEGPCRVLSLVDRPWPDQQWKPGDRVRVALSGIDAAGRRRRSPGSVKLELGSPAIAVCRAQPD